MSCDTCNERGFITNFEDLENIDTEYQPCSDCESECEKCNNTGWVDSVVEDGQEPCFVCWDWEVCSDCGGAGQFVQQMPGPDGGIVDEYYPCEKCGTKGEVCVAWLRDTEERPSEPLEFTKFN